MLRVCKLLIHSQLHALTSFLWFRGEGLSFVKTSSSLNPHCKKLLFKIKNKPQPKPKLFFPLGSEISLAN